MMNYNEIERALTNGATESKVITKLFKDQTAYNTVMSNCQRIGGKRFCCIPLELLEIDEDYQRVYCINMEKVYSLVRKWDFNKCEPVLVSPHPETATFAVIDGSHRMLAKRDPEREICYCSSYRRITRRPYGKKNERSRIIFRTGR